MTATVDDAFTQALAQDAQASPPQRPDVPAPPKRPSTADPDAPFGRDEHGEPIAPHGLSKSTGRPRLKPAGPGRPPRDDRPRVTPAAQAPAPAKARKDYTPAIGDFLDGLWMLGSGLPIPGRIGTRAQAQAAILKANKSQLAGGANTAAQNSAQFAAIVDKVTAGEASWILPVMFAATPFVAQSVMLWRAPAEGDVTALAAHNRAEWEAFIASATAAAAGQDQDQDQGQGQDAAQPAAGTAA